MKSPKGKREKKVTVYLNLNERGGISSVSLWSQKMDCGCDYSNQVKATITYTPPTLKQVK